MTGFCFFIFNNTDSKNQKKTNSLKSLTNKAIQFNNNDIFI